MPTVLVESLAHVSATGHLRKMIPALEQGGSQPHLFQTDAGQFLVKVANNPQGRQVLPNELVAGLCLHWLGVDHPRTVVVDIQEAVIIDSPEARFTDGTPLCAGLAFGSEYWPSDPGGTVPVSELVNDLDIAGAMVHAAWLRNYDGGQYRVKSSKAQPGKYEFFPVDHAFCFGQPDWTPQKIDADRQIEIRSPVKPVQLSTTARFVNQLATFDNAVADQILGQVPQAWLTSQQVASLRAYLVERARLAARELSTKSQSGGS
jgi:hypothetical protein